MNRENSGRTVLLVLFAFLLLAGTFTGGVLIGWKIPQKVSDKSEIQENLFAPFWDTWDYVHAGFVNQPVDDTKLMQGAIRGMLDSLGDDHTNYMDPEEYAIAKEPLDGSFEGIGAYVDASGKYLTIISAIPGSPAADKGLKSGDEVIKVNGEDVTGIDPGVVLRSVKGPAGTDVNLTFLRPESNETFEVTITRQKIALESVNSEMLDGEIAYVYINIFGEKTGIELETALESLMAQNPKGLILDLRFNSGGYVDAAVEVMSQFISEGVVLIEQEGSGEEITYSAKPGGLATELPLVVLVNEGTASASEITAGTIQDYGRGILVGETTYGKGSVQALIPFEDNQGAVRITVARWLTPNHRQINDVGITPDVVVPITDEDIEKEIDPQLEKAIEILRQSK